MTLRTGKNYPTKVRTGFAKRVQDFSTDKQRTVEPAFEMGNATPVGVSADQKQYTASLSWNPVDNSLEQALANLGDVAVSLQAIIDATPMLVESHIAGISDARVTSLEYSCQVGGEFRGSAQLRGTGFTDGDASITATAPSGAGLFKAKDVVVLAGTTRAVRAQGFNLGIQIPAEENYELSEEDPFEITVDNPNITLDVDWLEDTLATGQVEPEIASPTDFTIVVGGTGKKILVKNLVWNGVSVAGRVKGAGTRKYRYVSSGDATTGGVNFDTNTAPSSVTLTPSPLSPQVKDTEITLTGAGTDTDGIFRVDFYVGTIKIGSDISSPYTCAWTPDRAGVYSLTCVVQDVFGAKTTSSPVSYTITDS